MAKGLRRLLSGRVTTRTPLALANRTPGRCDGCVAHLSTRPGGITQVQRHRCEMMCNLY